MKRRFGGTFATRLVRTYPYGTDPALPGLIGAPTPIRNTMRFGVITGEGGYAKNGWMNAGAAGPIPSAGEFTVADNDFTTGIALLVLGEYKLIANVDFIPGIGVNATATAVAAAISRLPGFGATSNGPLVQVTWDGPVDEVEFYAIHYGTVVNFDPFDPVTGFIGMGRPAISAPQVTV